MGIENIKEINNANMESMANATAYLRELQSIMMQAGEHSAFHSIAIEMDAALIRVEHGISNMKEIFTA